MRLGSSALLLLGISLGALSGAANSGEPEGGAYARRLLERVNRYPVPVRIGRCEKIPARLGGPEKAVPLLKAYVAGPRPAAVNCAVIALGKCGKHAIPVLAGLLKDKHAGENAAVHLGYCGKDAEPHLLE